VDLISIDDLDDAQVAHVLDRAIALHGGAAGVGGHEGRILFNLFFEASTRTLMSFATATHRLGATALTLPVEQSSVKKGEVLEDTVRTLDAMRPDALVIRHGDNGSVATAATIMDCPVINAGDGTNEHPTQALLDAATIRLRLGRVEGLKVAICGDIKHSRVARSNAKLLARLGAEVRLAGPPELMPAEAAKLSVDEAISGAHVVMMLRVQRERLDEEFGDAPGEYLRLHGLTDRRLATAAPDAVVMHPGPMNRGVEIAGTVADDPARSLVSLQVAMGVATRMACLELLLA
jgi:aspartate carbamoyltransferase catalytic subunit